MPSMQVKGVPGPVHAELCRRAAVAGKSLQEYLLELLIEEVAHPPLDDLLDRTAARTGSDLSMQLIVDSIREDRDAS